LRGNDKAACNRMSAFGFSNAQEATRKIESGEVLAAAAYHLPYRNEHSSFCVDLRGLV